jgi:drug/metabolite transporter (DMT)-like permease
MTRTTRLALFAAAAILPWGASFMVNKWVLRELGPATLSLYRWALASGLYLAYLLATKRMRPMWESLRRKPLVFFVLGLLCLPVPYLAQNYALKFTSVINVSVLLDLDPAFIVVMGVILLHERVTRLQAFGVAVAVAGTVVITASGDALSLTSKDVVGNLLSLLAAGSFSLYTIVIKTSAREFDAVTSSVLPTLLGTALLVPPAIVEGLTWPAHPLTWASIVFLGVLCSAVATLAWVIVVRELDASKSAPLVFLIPVVAGVLAITLLGERPTAQTLLGAALILGGVYFSERNAHGARENRAPSAESRLGREQEETA